MVWAYMRPPQGIRLMRESARLPWNRKLAERGEVGECRKPRSSRVSFHDYHNPADWGVRWFRVGGGRRRMWRRVRTRAGLAEGRLEHPRACRIAGRQLRMGDLGKCVVRSLRRNVTVSSHELTYSKQTAFTLTVNCQRIVRNTPAWGRGCVAVLPLWVQGSSHEPVPSVAQRGRQRLATGRGDARRADEHPRYRDLVWWHRAAKVGGQHDAHGLHRVLPGPGGMGAVGVQDGLRQPAETRPRDFQQLRRAPRSDSGTRHAGSSADPAAQWVDAAVPVPDVHAGLFPVRLRRDHPIAV